MKNILKALLGVFDKITSSKDFIISDKRIKGVRAQETDELVTLEQLNEFSGENVARLDLDNVFLEDNFFEKPVFGQNAIEEGQFVTLRQLTATSTKKVKVVLSEDKTINWLIDEAGGGKSYADLIGNDFVYTAYYTLGGRDVAYQPTLAITRSLDGIISKVEILDVSPGYIVFI